MEKESRVRGQGNASRCTKKSSKARYSKKRVHWKKKREKEQEAALVVEDQSTVEVEVVNDEASLPSTSYTKKVIDIETADDEKYTGCVVEGYYIIDMAILSQTFSLIDVLS